MSIATYNLYLTYWDRISVDNGATIFASTTVIHEFHIAVAVQEALNLNEINGQSRPILILSGIHGTQDGDNWVREIRNARIVQVFRSDLSHQRYVYEEEDTVLFSHITSNVIALDIRNIPATLFANILTERNAHIILAYCYSRNDVIVRYLFNLPIYNYSKCKSTDLHLK